MTAGNWAAALELDRDHELSVRIEVAASTLARTGGQMFERWVDRKPARPQQIASARRALITLQAALIEYDRARSEPDPLPQTMEASNGR